ncbi:MAG: hypothetical protein JRI23_19210, partial [Deltaproteobacteria bacterium]|nr:hypothetical protein [Deltaproteobacteria bacterium]MBW2533995.1 hypothetical protein [Deltaproteobacteria bacterium]
AGAATSTAPSASSPERPKPTGGLLIDDAEIRSALEQTAALRGLPVLRPVEAKRLGRQAVIDHIKAKVKREIPPGVLQAQGELLRGLELIPGDYDYVAGIYALLEEQVAGFYDPEIPALVLLDDLSESGAEETLAHELVHALQDQHYDLETKLDYRPHDSDSVAAVQTLSEGDATHAMFDAAAGAVVVVSEEVFRMALVASTALSQSGSTTPRVLQAALIAPYVDGFSLVSALRQRGGWAAVDAMWRQPPASTEQVIHLDKYQAGEPPIHVPVPSLDALGPGWTVMDHDVLGEQGLRIALEQWASRATARRAAAGWGGDRYAVAGRALTPEAARTDIERVAAWLIRMDSSRDAAELGRVLDGAFGRGCKERPALGAITWLRRGTAVVIAIGPYVRSPDGTHLPAAPSCPTTRAWARAMLRR